MVEGRLNGCTSTTHGFSGCFLCVICFNLALAWADGHVRARGGLVVAVRRRCRRIKHCFCGVVSCMYVGQPYRIRQPSRSRVAQAGAVRALLGARNGHSQRVSVSADGATGGMAVAESGRWGFALVYWCTGRAGVLVRWQRGGFLFLARRVRSAAGHSGLPSPRLPLPHHFITHHASRLAPKPAFTTTTHPQRASSKCTRLLRASGPASSRRTSSAPLPSNDRLPRAALYFDRHCSAGCSFVSQTAPRPCQTVRTSTQPRRSMPRLTQAPTPAEPSS